MSTNKSYVASGFKEDCELLIARFENGDDVRFLSFCEIWKDMKFSLVFNYRSSASELWEFCEEALHISKQFLLLSKRFKERIAGLYLLYGIYYKMPVNLFKIRIKLTDWVNIMELHTQIKEGEHLDANYILSKLITDNAFHYCIFDYEFGLEKHYRTKKRQCINPYSVLPAIKDFIEQGELLTTIGTLSKLYHQQKCDISSKSTGVPSLNLFNINVGKEIINDIQKLDVERQNLQTSRYFNNKKKSEKAESKQKLKKKHISRVARDKVRGKVGHGFDTDDSKSEDETSSDEADNCESK